MTGGSVDDDDNMQALLELLANLVPNGMVMELCGTLYLVGEEEGKRVAVPTTWEELEALQEGAKRPS